jgi:transposase-like protein
MLLFCRILIIDGKYVAVKGYEAKIPFIYGIDYLTHDIPHGDLFTVEDEAAFSQFLTKLKDIGYVPRVVIADDRQGLKQALNKVFPYCKLQLCHVHFVENIRQLLNIRTDERYHHFFNSLVAHVFKVKKEDKIIKGLTHVFYKRTYGNRNLQNIVTSIKHRQTELFNYLQIKNCPNNTNLIELYNSHLQARLKSIKGFQSFESAQRWLNGYLIRRRTKPLTDCKTKFKKLNGFASLQFTISNPTLWPTNISGIKAPKKEPKR